MFLLEFGLYIGLFIYLFVAIAIIIALVSLVRISKALTKIAENLSKDNDFDRYS